MYMLFQNDIPCLEEITTKLLIQSHLEHGEERWKKKDLSVQKFGLSQLGEIFSVLIFFL